MSEQYQTDYDFHFEDGIRVGQHYVAGQVEVTYDLDIPADRPSGLGPYADDVVLVHIGRVRVEHLINEADAGTDRADELPGWGYIADGDPRSDAIRKALWETVHDHIREHVAVWHEGDAEHA